MGPTLPPASVAAVEPSCASSAEPTLPGSEAAGGVPVDRTTVSCTTKTLVVPEAAAVLLINQLMLGGLGRVVRRRCARGAW